MNNDINKNKAKEYSKAYRLRNPDKIQAYNKQYKLTHKEEIRKYNGRYREHQKIYYQDHKKHASETGKQYRILHREKHLWQRYKDFDKKNKLIFDLTKDWIRDNIVSKSCVYCGDTRDLGCDRIDNTKGHTQSNCVPCCLTCNHARNVHFSHEEMFELGATIRQIKQKRTNT